MNLREEAKKIRQREYEVSKKEISEGTHHKKIINNGELLKIGDIVHHFEYGYGIVIHLNKKDAKRQIGIRFHKELEELIKHMKENPNEEYFEDFNKFFNWNEEFIK